MKKKRASNENYLDRVPCRRDGIEWSVDGEEKVTLHIENKGIFNRAAQLILKKPKISHVHLDENGSFVWPLINGERDITAIGELVHERFGEAAEPLYPRLAKFFQVLASYGFVTFK